MDAGTVKAAGVDTYGLPGGVDSIYTVVKHDVQIARRPTTSPAGSPINRSPELAPGLTPDPGQLLMPPGFAGSAGNDRLA